MPIIKSAVKRAKQSSKRRDRNIEIKRAIKSATKAFMANPSADTLAKANSELDKAVKKGLLKKNTVERRKMRLSRIAKEAGVKLGSAKVSTKAPTKTTTKSAETAKKAPVKKTTPKTTAKATAKAPAKKTVAKKPAAKK